MFSTRSGRTFTSLSLSTVPLSGTPPGLPRVLCRFLSPRLLVCAPTLGIRLRTSLAGWRTSGRAPPSRSIGRLPRPTLLLLLSREGISSACSRRPIVNGNISLQADPVKRPQPDSSLPHTPGAPEARERGRQRIARSSPGWYDEIVSRAALARGLTPDGQRCGPAGLRH